MRLVAVDVRSTNDRKTWSKKKRRDDVKYQIFTYVCDTTNYLPVDSLLFMRTGLQMKISNACKGMVSSSSAHIEQSATENLHLLNSSDGWVKRIGW